MDGLHGSPQGEQIQWHDLYVSLLLLGYHPTLVHHKRQLTADYLEEFNVVITDYCGVHYAVDQLALAKHRCKLRVLDSWGTDAIPNMNTQQGNPFCCLKLPSLSQFWTFTPTGPCPANSYLGYAVTSFRLLQDYEAEPTRELEIVLYGKEYKFLVKDLAYIKQLSQFAPTHATAMGWPTGQLQEVHNHGVLSPTALHELMQKTFAYAGFAAVMMGPAAIEALSQGMVFLNYAFVPPANFSITQGKPTTQLWTSQFPFLESQQPHALTVNPRDPADVTAKLHMVKQLYNKWWVMDDYVKVPTKAKFGPYVFLGMTKGHRSGFVPYEYTTVAMLLRVSSLMQQNACQQEDVLLET
jgi:hypothetical protein